MQGRGGNQSTGRRSAQDRSRHGLPPGPCHFILNIASRWKRLSWRLSYLKVNMYHHPCHFNLKANLPPSKNHHPCHSILKANLPPSKNHHPCHFILKANLPLSKNLAILSWILTWQIAHRYGFKTKPKSKLQLNLATSKCTWTQILTQSQTRNPIQNPT